MKEMFLIQSIVFGAAFLLTVVFPVYGAQGGDESPSIIKLPEPKVDGKVPLEKAIFRRRSVRDYRGDALTMGEVSQLLYAAQGSTDPKGLRSTPSAGALYPLEVYVVAGRVEGLLSGIYRYRSRGHELIKVVEGRQEGELAAAALGQSWIKDAPASIVISAVYERTTGKYRDRGLRYVHMEAGHAAQNVCLQAVAAELGSVIVGAFSDNDVKTALHMPDPEEPLVIIPVGRSR